MKKFELSENALTVANSRYFMEDENWETCTHRVAKAISEAEPTNQNEYLKKFHEMIFDGDFVPGGRILRNSGRLRGSLFNCYVLPIGDSIEEIGTYYKESLQLWSEGGGVGVNFSNLRPRGDIILGKGGSSSGLVSFLESSDHISKTIESGGSRRAAGLACVDVSHPEIIDFIDSKLVNKRLSHYNISVIINNEFLEAVESDSDWEFKFKQRVYGKIKARKLWSKIVKNMVDMAEPGLLNSSNLMKNNSYYFDPIVSTNPCGEVPLGNYNVCDLGSLILPNFITGTTNTNWKKLEQTIKLAVRFLDNVIDVNKYTIKAIDIKAHENRRIGLGVLGLANYLFLKQIKYGSEKSIIEIEKLMKFIRDCTYQASIELAVEKGAFPKFDNIPYLKASFIRKLPVNLRMDIKEKGIRNVTCLSVAPNGTISLLFDYIGGIEPLYSKAYERSDKIGKRVYIDKLYNNFLDNNQEIPDWYVDSFDLEPKDHFEVQSIVQKYIDCAVSKTINLPKDTTSNQLSKLLLEYAKDLKGVTVYRDGCREGQVLTRLSEKEVKEIYNNKNKKLDSNLTENDVRCSTGSCEL